MQTQAISELITEVNKNPTPNPVTAKQSSSSTLLGGTGAVEAAVSGFSVNVFEDSARIRQ